MKRCGGPQSRGNRLPGDATRVDQRSAEESTSGILTEKVREPVTIQIEAQANEPHRQVFEKGSPELMQRVAQSAAHDMALERQPEMARRGQRSGKQQRAREHAPFSPRR